MSAIVVERVLDYFGPDSNAQAYVRVFAPQPDRYDWRCEYELEWPGYHRKLATMGVDQWQSLHLAMHIVPSSIYATDDFKRGRIGLWKKRLASYEEICAAFDVKPVEGPKQ